MFSIADGVSGGHFNPATSLAVMIGNMNIGKDILKFVIMFFSQFMGAFFGVLIIYLAFQDPNSYDYNDNPQQNPSPNIPRLVPIA